MKSSLLLLDVAPDPVPNVGEGGMILILVVVLMLLTVGIWGLIFFLKWLMRRSVRVTSPANRDPQFQPSNPNQP